ncbi:MAG TPA: hypothetical protein PK729_19935 [Candidatus Hydrogenedentes bacterium]|nr:hypothetical protein [Candidatus Hydrogenedentota bacterium]
MTTSAGKGHDGRRAFWWHAFVMITLAFLSGMAAGGAAAAICFLSAGFRFPEGARMDPVSVMDFLREDLNLSPEKEDAVRAILRNHHAQFMAYRRETMPRMQALFDQLRDDIAAELTPEQAALWRQRFETSRRRSFPIGKMIWLADMNNDRLVDEAELRAGFPEMGPEWFKQTDTNADGVLDEAEIENAAQEPELTDPGPP